MNFVIKLLVDVWVQKGWLCKLIYMSVPMGGVIDDMAKTWGSINGRGTPDGFGSTGCRSWSWCTVVG